MKTAKRTFTVFGLVWAAYLLVSLVLLIMLFVPYFGDISVYIAVSIGLISWILGFLRWGPVLGNWEKEHDTRGVS